MAFFALALPLVRLLEGRRPAWSALGPINGLPDVGLFSVWALLVLLHRDAAPLEGQDFGDWLGGIGAGNAPTSIEAAPENRP